MTSAFRTATHLEGTPPGTRSGSIDDSWYQGRGAFGGLLAAILLTAMRDAVGDATRIPRSLTLHFCAPATAGAFERVTEVVRSGSRVTHTTARLSRDGAVTTFASASFGRPRDAGERYAHAPMPGVERADEAKDFPRGVPGVPAFFEHLDVRFCGPTRPFAGGRVPAVAAWVRLREAAPIDAAVAALLLDVLPPAITSTFAGPRAVASVDFNVQFFGRLPEPGGSEAADEHHLVSIASRWADDGYTEELRDLFSPRGVLLAQCRQLLALL